MSLLSKRQYEAHCLYSILERFAAAPPRLRGNFIRWYLLEVPNPTTWDFTANGRILAQVGEDDHGQFLFWYKSGTLVEGNDRLIAQRIRREFKDILDQ